MGKLSLRDDKEPQMLINRARPISDYTDGVADSLPEEPKQKAGTLYIKLSGDADPNYRKVKAMINMFPGEEKVVVFFADTRLMRGARAELDSRLLSELTNLLGKENVIVK